MERKKEERITLLISSEQDLLDMLKLSARKQLSGEEQKRIRFLLKGGIDFKYQILTIYESATNQLKDFSVNVIILEKLAEKSIKRDMSEDLLWLKEFCSKHASAGVCMQACFFLPEECKEEEKEDAYANAYARLQKLEYDFMLREAAYDNVVLISGDGKDQKAMISDALISLLACEGNEVNTELLYGNWREAKKAYLEGRDILSNGLIKSTVFPEDSHSYCGIGYAAAEVGLGSAAPFLVKSVYEELFGKIGKEGTVWIENGERNFKSQFPEALTDRLFCRGTDAFFVEEFCEERLLAPLKKIALLEDNQVEINRADINAGNVDGYDAGFHIEEKVAEGIKSLEMSCTNLTKSILKNAGDILEDYGPGMIAGLFFAEAETAFASVWEVLGSIYEQMVRMKQKVKRRPVHQIVGGLSESVMKERIDEWKYHYRQAVETEICKRAAESFLLERGGWADLVINPLKKFADQCRIISKNIEKLSEGAAWAPDPSGSNVSDLGLDEDIRIWLKKEVSDSVGKMKAGSIKRALAHSIWKHPQLWIDAKGASREFLNVVLKAGEEEGISLRKKITVFAYFENSLLEKEEETGDAIYKFASRIAAPLVKKSEPSLKCRHRSGDGNRFFVLPETLLKGSYGEKIKEAFTKYFIQYEKEKWEIKSSAWDNRIICYQSCVGIGLYEVKNLSAWEKEYNRKMLRENSVDWKRYFPLSLNDVERNELDKKFYNEKFCECIEYAWKEKIIQRKQLQEVEKNKYLYVINLIPDSWIILGKEWREEKYQRNILLPDAGYFSKPFDFSEAESAGMDLESIGLHYVKRILRRNMPLFWTLEKTVEKYKTIEKPIEKEKIEKPEAKEVRTKPESKSLESGKKYSKFCKYCGVALKKGTEKFCPKCGGKLG